MYARLWMPVVLGFSLSLPVAAQTPGGPSECRAESAPERPPSRSEAARRALFTALRDSIGTEVRETARAEGISTPTGLVLIELRNRRTGEAETSVFGSNVSQALAARAVERRAAMLARMPRDASLLHIRLDPLPTDGTGAECLPELLNAREFAQRIQQMTRSLPTAPDEESARLSMRVRMLVNREGEVVFATLDRRSMRGDIDRQILEMARELRFRPARLDGVPVDTWVQQPVELYMLVDGSRRRVREP